MQKRTKTSIFMWVYAAALILVVCWPVGIYTMIQANRMQNSYKLGDNERVEECIRKIKKTYKVFGCIILAIIILAVVVGIVA